MVSALVGKPGADSVATVPSTRPPGVACSVAPSAASCQATSVDG